MKRLSSVGQVLMTSKCAPSMKTGPLWKQVLGEVQLRTLELWMVIGATKRKRVTVDDEGWCIPAILAILTLMTTCS